MAAHLESWRRLVKSIGKRWAALAVIALLAFVALRAEASMQDVKTVFIILEENTSWSSIRGSSAAPYINHALLPMASHAEQYFTPPGLHPSLPNYLWLEAGTNFNITSDVDPSSGHQSTTNHLVTLLKNAGISWTSYQEDISGTTCPLTAVSQYAPKHNPMVYFDDVTNTNNTGSTYCISNVRPFSQLTGDLQSNTVSRYNFITPNLCDDMHGNTGCPGGSLITAGDTWLSNNVPTILNSQAYSNNGALFIVWDEGGSSSDGPIGMIVISRLAKGGGYSNTVHYTHSSTLKSMQEIFNVTPLLRDAANATDLSDLFNPSPGVTNITPSCGPTTGGTAVTITGSNFLTGATVTIGGVSASNVVVVSSNTVTAFSPTNAVGAKIVSVTNTNGTFGALTNGFTYVLSPSPSNNGPICSGQTLNLFANTNADSYSWTGPNGFTSTAQNPSIANVTTAATGTYSLTVGCASAVGTTTVTINQTPATPSPSNNGPICSGQTLNLSANTTAPGYSWTGPNSFSSSAQNPSIPNATAAATGTYNLTVTSNGCASAVGSTAATVNQTPAAPSPSNNGPICSSNQTLNLFANTIADSYSWTGPNSFSSSAQNPSIPSATTAATGTYNLTVTSNGCTSAVGSTAATVNEAPATPSVPAITTPSAGFCINAASAAAFTVSGTADTNITVQIFANATLIGVTTADGAGNWSTNLNFIAQADGPVSLTAVAATPCDSSAPSPAINGTKDATAPSFAGLDTATPAIESATLAWSAAVDSNTVTYQVFQSTTSGAENFGTPTLTTNSLSVLIAPLYPGSNSPISYFFVVRATDSCGNTETNTVEKSLQPLLDPNKDQDGDGMPNGFEQAHGLNPFNASDANIDSDGDGMSNLQEFLAGTDPTNRTSVFRITSVVRAGNDVSVTWTMGPGKTNALQSTAGTGGGSYQTNGFTDLFVVTDTVGTTTNYLDSGGATNSPFRYYRVRLVP